MVTLSLQPKNGFALLLAMLVSSVVLAIGVAILQITVSQINLASTARESEIAFQAAQSGVECMMYWRNRSASYAYPANIPPRDPNCFGGNKLINGDGRTVKSDSTGDVHRYSYDFNAGTASDRCIKTVMFVMVSSADSDLEYSAFNSNAIGVNGRKTCPAGRVCNVLISAGHNRSCADLSTSIFTVQRELTVEF